MPEVRREAERQLQEAALEDGILWHSLQAVKEFFSSLLRRRFMNPARAPSV